MAQRVTPLALLLSSAAYFYNSANNVANLASFTSTRALNSNDSLGYTNYGILRGTRSISRTGKSYYQFRGVPYAAPPLEDLRFEPPQPVARWDGIKDATQYGNQCLQMNLITRRNIVGNEDCLFLNVYTHKVLKGGESKRGRLDPVIVYVHGGLFMGGSANLYRPKYFMDENVVLVTINYRLTSFGFLNTGDEVVPGNMGLKDQTFALKWVKENIAYFGGDPKRVTLMGESAGAASTHFHTLSPLSKGLFHRVISMSGSALSPWALVEKPSEQFKEFSTDLGCEANSTVEAIKCMKSLDYTTIAKAHFGYINALASGKRSAFGPTIESVVNNKTFLPAHPLELMKSKRINKVPWMTGVNAEEGLVYLIPIIRNSTMNEKINTEWEKYAPLFLNLHTSERSTKLLKEIRDYYLNGSDISITTIKQSANMLSDRGFFLDNHDAAILHAKVADVYAYYYKYNGRYAMAKLLFVKSPLPFPIPDRYDFAIGTAINWFAENVLRMREPNRFGIGHSDEIPLFFNAPLIRREVSLGDEDYSMSRRLVSLWSSFAETGVPNWKGVEGPRWYPVNKHSSGNVSIKRLHLDSRIKMSDEPFFERLMFWKERNVTYI